MYKIINEIEKRNNEINDNSLNDYNKNNRVNKNIEKNKRKGISLIALIIIIIVTLIITSVVMLTVLDTSPIEDANEAVIRSDIRTMQEEYELAYSDAYAKNLGEEEKITNSDLVGVIPNKYKTDFKATTDGIIYIGNNETIKKIAADMGIEKREYNVIEDVVINSKISSIDVEVVAVAGEVIDEYVYQIRQKGTSEWNEFNSVNNTLTIENLLENVEYEVKILAIQGEKTYESEIISVLTQEEIKLGTLTLKLNSASGENYVENTWANTKVYVSVSGENTTYSVSGANTVSETSSATVLTSDGVSIITLKTIKDTASKTQDYTVKIDKGMPEIKELSSNATGLTNREITITGKVQDSISGIIAYMFSTDASLTASSNGWNQIESTTEEITKEYKVSENNKYYFYVMDSAKNVTKQEIQIDKYDNTLPTDTAPTLTSTTNTVTATFKQTDENGIDNSTRAYAIKKTADSTWGEFVTSDSDSYTFERLDKNTSYDVKTYVVDNARNENTSQVASISTIDITKPEINAPEDWVSTSVEVTITYPEIVGTTREYSLDGSNWDTVDTLEKKVQVSTNNTVVYARVIDSTNQSSGNVEYEVKCIDSSKPQINSFIKDTAPTNTAVTLTGKAIDAESGIVAYMFSTDGNLTANSTGWTEIVRTTEEIEYTYSANENTKYYFYVKNDADLVEKAEVIVDNIDKVEPTLDNLEVVSPATGTYKAGQEIEMVATYSENITGTVPVLRIKFGTGIERTISSGTIENNTIKYTYKVQDGDNGELVCTSYYGTLTDIAGNNVTVSRKDFSGNGITADTKAPILSSINVISPSAGTYAAGQELEIVATYSENITGTAPVLKVKFGTGTERTISSGTIENNTIKYTYTIRDGDNGLLTSTEYEGEVTDSVGNKLTVSNKSLGGNNITADTTLPTNIAPTLTSTTNSIVATFKQTDNNGIDNTTRAYAIKKTADSTWEEFVTSDSETYTFERLDKNTSYDVKTKVSDTVGNENESEIATINTVNITNPSIVASTDLATSVDVIITYPEIEGTTREYSLDGINWYQVEGTVYTVTVDKNNTTVYARIIDSTEQVSDTVSYEVTNIDADAPTLSSIAVTSPATGTYKAGQEIKIVATYSENIYGTAPVLKIKFENTEERTLNTGKINGNKITYKYTITDQDNGLLTSTEYVGKVTDSVGNSLIVKNEPITGNLITANTEYTITYNLNGGKNPNDVVEKYNYASENITLSTPTKVGYTFDGWYETEDFSTDKVTIITKGTTGNKKFWAKWTANTNTEYKVQHWLQNIDGDADSHDDENYSLKETITLQGTTDSSVTPNVESYEGFTAPEVQQSIIAADGSLIVDYYYERNSYTVTLHESTGIESVSGAGIYLYGKEVTIKAVVSEGYEWAGWTGTHNVKDQTYTFVVEGDVTITATASTAGLDLNEDGDGGVSGVVPPADEPETPEEIPEEALQLIEFNVGEFVTINNYTPGEYETVEYEETYTRTKYPVNYQNIVWSKWQFTYENDVLVNTEPKEIALSDIDEQYSEYIIYDFETDEALVENGVEGDSVELWAIYSDSDDNLENIVYLAAYLNKLDGCTSRHIAKWNGSQYVAVDYDTNIAAVKVFTETYTVTKTKQVEIKKPESSTKYVYVPTGTMKAVKDMTWEEWMVSDYNTTGMTDPIIKTADFEDVAYTEAIVEGKSYGFYVESELEAGLYDANDNLIASWDELVESGELGVNSGVLIYFDDFQYDDSKLVISDSVTSLADMAFVGSKVTSIIIPESVTSIGASTFWSCNRLKSIVIPESVTSIGNSAFNGCSSLASVTIPSSVTSIGDSAFNGCSSLASVTIPSSVTSIGAYTFDECNGLKTIVIPESVTSIGNSAFRDCSSLTSVYFEHTTAPTFKSECFYKTSGDMCTFYFKNATVRSKFTTSYYNSSYGTLSTNYSWTAPSETSATNFSLRENVEYTEPEEANITVTVQENETVTGIYIVANDKEGIQSLTILDANQNLVKEIALNGESSYSELVDITDSGTYTVNLVTSTGTTKQMTFEI